MFATAPFCAGYAFHACRHAGAKIPAYLGLALAAAEVLLLTALVVVGLIASSTG
jgi:hypothetical protein